MDERSASRLRIVFKMVYKGQCILSEIEDADTVILNVDNESAESVLTEFKLSYSQKPVIILSEESITVENIPCLTRPFKLPELLDAIKKTSLFSKPSISHKAKKTAESLVNKMTKSNGLVIKNSKAVVHKNSGIYYQPKSFLQGKVTAAIEKANSQKVSVFLRCWSHRWIVVSPSSGYLVENLKERQLANMGIVNTESDVVCREESFSEEQMALMAETPTKEVKVTSIEKFIWDIAVRTSRGRMPEGTSIDDLYTLERWPNLTRLAKINNSMRISAFWIDQPRSINNVASQLNISTQDVFTYFSAASASGLIKKNKKFEKQKIKPKMTKINENKKGLFSAILRKLSRFSSTPKPQNEPE